MNGEMNKKIKKNTQKQNKKIQKLQQRYQRAWSFKRLTRQIQVSKTINIQKMKQNKTQLNEHKQLISLQFFHKFIEVFIEFLFVVSEVEEVIFLTQTQLEYTVNSEQGSDQANNTEKLNIQQNYENLYRDPKYKQTKHKNGQSSEEITQKRQEKENSNQKTIENRRKKVTVRKIYKRKEKNK